MDRIMVKDPRTMVNSCIGEMNRRFIPSSLLQLGVALGFLVPPAIVPTTDDMDLIGQRLSIMFYGVVALTTTLFITILIGKTV